MDSSQIFATGLSGTVGRHLKGSATAIMVDLSSTSKEFLKINLPKHSTIIHLGAVVGESRVQENKGYATKVNVEGTKNLGEVALRTKCKKFIYVSTSHVYKSKDSAINENDVLEATSYYSESKLAGEEAIAKILEDSEVELTVIRLFSILDWGMPPFTLGGAVERIINGEDLIIPNGDDERDFLTPKTIASTLLKLSDLNNLPPILNLCSGKAFSVLDAVSALFQAAQYTQRNPVNRGHSKNPRILGDSSVLNFLLPKEKFEWKVSQHKLMP